MKNAVLSIKVDQKTKEKAQSVAGNFGFPLSTLVNAYLTELANTGQIHFSTVEPMTKRMETLIEGVQAEIEAGNTVGPFKTAEEAITYLNKL